MPHKLDSEKDVWKLLSEVKEGFGTRDTLWQARRKVRYREMDQELRGLPLSPRVADTALMVHQTEMPNQEIHKRCKRLVANAPRFEVVVFDDDPTTQRLGQELENWVKALYKWMTRGKVPFDWLVTQFQQGDGLGIGKVEFLPGHGVSLGSEYKAENLEREDEDEEEEGIEEEERESRRKRNEVRGRYREAVAKYDEEDTSRDAKAYYDITQEALKKELPPFRITAVDPLACYWWEDGDGIALIAESGKKSLDPVLAAFSSYGLSLQGNRLVRSDTGGDILEGQTVPDTSASRDLSREVEYTEIRTREEIVIFIEHPRVKGATKDAKSAGQGVIFRFPNPFGPYTTGYALVPGDVTTHADPAFMYQPPALGTINIAQAYNVLETARLSAAIDAALAPPYVEVKPETPVPPQDEDKTPEAQTGRAIPVIPGEIKRIEAPQVQLKDVQESLLQENSEFRFQDALVGDATSDTSGHRLAIQVAQADIQLVPYQNARAAAITELMRGIIYAARKHGLAIYVPTLPDSRKRGQGIQVAEPARFTPEMADINFDLVVKLGAETPVTKFAKWQALQDREERGTLGYMTLLEESDIEDPLTEIARIFEGKTLKAVMEQSVPKLVEMVLNKVEQAFAQAVAPQPPIPIPMGPGPETGLVGGGGAQPTIDQIVRLPGVNAPVVQSSREFGMPVPEPAELGAVP